MKNSPQYNPEFVGADTRKIAETEFKAPADSCRDYQLN